MAKTIPKLTARLSVDDAIGISPYNVHKPLHTRCKIIAHLGQDKIALPSDYYWNGANIPTFFWSLLGVVPTDPRAALASGFHDRACEDSETPQVIADATFAALLGPIYFNDILIPGFGKYRVMALYGAVRFYSLFVRGSTRLFWKKEN